MLPTVKRVLTSPEATLLDYQDVGVLLLLRKYGLRVRELPTPMLPRCAGHSRVFSSWFKVAGYMLQTTLLCLARVRRLGVSDRAMRRAEGLSA